MDVTDLRSAAFIRWTYDHETSNWEPTIYSNLAEAVEGADTGSTTFVINRPVAWTVAEADRAAPTLQDTVDARKATARPRLTREQREAILVLAARSIMGSKAPVKTASIFGRIEGRLKANFAASPTPTQLGGLLQGCSDFISHGRAGWTIHGASDLLDLKNAPEAVRKQFQAEDVDHPPIPDGESGFGTDQRGTATSPIPTENAVVTHG